MPHRSVHVELYVTLQFPVKQTNNHFEMSKQVEHHSYRVPLVEGLDQRAAECTEQVRHLTIF